MTPRRFLWTAPFLAACALALLAAPPARTQDEDVPPVKIILRPAAAPSPALRYRLLPEVCDQTPGNAAPLYRKAGALLKSIPADADQQRRDVERLEKWEQVALGELPRAEVRRFLAPYRVMFRLIDEAARKEYCDWGLSERIRKQGFNTTLEDQQPLRDLARFLVLRARLEMAEGHPDQAVRTLQSGFAMSGHVGASPLPISCLIGLASARNMTHWVEEMIQQPGAPNLYWALTDLPRPFFDLRRAFEGERLTLYCALPGVGAAAADLSAGPVPAEQIQAAMAALSKLERGADNRAVRTALALLVRKRHPAAKKALIAAGRPEALVDKMPPMQVALLHSLLQYDRFLDDIVKWQSFPYPEAQKGLDEVMRQLRQARANVTDLNAPPDTPAVPLAVFLTPAFRNVSLTRTHLDRKIAALRCLEAMRLHAASHRGKLPATLGDIKEVPVPDDPVTGKPFRYRVAENKAVLSGPTPVGEQPTGQTAISYEVTLQR